MEHGTGGPCPLMGGQRGQEAFREMVPCMKFEVQVAGTSRSGQEGVPGRRHCVRTGELRSWGQGSWDVRLPRYL